MHENVAARPLFINPYIARADHYAEWVLMKEQPLKYRGKWREALFKNPKPLHVEIGTGNGFHFAHYAKTHPQISLVGFEIKFKTLVQSIARARRFGCENAVMVKGDAGELTRYFAPGEVDRLIIHFPDPWPKPSQQHNRLISDDFLKQAFEVLREGGEVEFKTDHPGYFRVAARRALNSPLALAYYTENLHRSLVAEENYVTQFESLFLRKGQPIYYFRLKKNSRN